MEEGKKQNGCFVEMNIEREICGLVSLLHIVPQIHEPDLFFSPPRDALVYLTTKYLTRNLIDYFIFLRKKLYCIK
jgi:predicted transcriptional regulator